MGRGLNTTGTRLPSEVRAVLARLVALLHAAPEQVVGLASSGEPADGHADALSAWLYASWYLALPQPDVASQAAAWRSDLSGALRAALLASTHWQEGWVVLERRGDGHCLIGRRGASRLVQPGEYVNRARPGVPAMPGDAVAVTACLEGVHLETGFWTTRSAADVGSPLVRVHWSVPAATLPLVVSRVVMLLEALALPFSLKTPSRVDACARVDTLVLYVSAADWPRLDGPVTTLAHEVGKHLRPWHPPLARPIAPGVAFAEDPGGHESFGQRRCRLLAGGVRSLIARGDVGVAESIAHLAHSLREGGLDPERPWLNDGG